MESYVVHSSIRYCCCRTVIMEKRKQKKTVEWSVISGWIVRERLFFSTVFFYLVLCSTSSIPHPPPTPISYLENGHIVVASDCFLTRTPGRDYMYMISNSVRADREPEIWQQTNSAPLFAAHSTAIPPASRESLENLGGFISKSETEIIFFCMKKNKDWPKATGPNVFFSNPVIVM